MSDDVDWLIEALAEGLGQLVPANENGPVPPALWPIPPEQPFRSRAMPPLWAA